MSSVADALKRTRIGDCTLLRHGRAEDQPLDHFDATAILKKWMIRRASTYGRPLDVEFERLRAYVELVALPDPPDLVGRGHHLTQPARASQREQTLWAAVTAHLAARRMRSDDNIVVRRRPQVPVTAKKSA